MLENPTGLTGGKLETFNVSVSWEKFSRIGTLGSPVINKRFEPVVSCQSGVKTGVKTVDNILYIDGNYRENNIF